MGCFVTDLVALNAAGCVFLFVTLGAVNLLLPGDEALCSYGSLAHAAAEAFLVPLPGLVFHLLRSCKEQQIEKKVIN